MKSVKVWDALVRTTHWGVALLVLANLLALEEGDAPHRWAGYAACALVAVRLLWGLVGSRHARFSDFWPTPARFRTHWQALRGRQTVHELGHNPFGALMMLALWACILGLGATGYLMGTDAYWGNETVEELHEGLSNALSALVLLHVAAVALMSWWSKINLTRAMLTGYKRLPDDSPASPPMPAPDASAAPQP